MNKAIFLDRDGTLNEVHTSRVQFVNEPNELYLLPGVAEAIAILRDEKYKIFVVTNQGGIGWGLISKETLHEIHQAMKQRLIRENPKAIIDDIAYCPHHPQIESCKCRKPRPGMLLTLAEKYQIDLDQSWMVGDRHTDIEAGQAAGCKTYRVDPNHSLLDFAHWVCDNKDE